MIYFVVLFQFHIIRYKRLMFGVSCAPELFQKVMESILADLDGIIVYLDDVVVHGRTQTEHDRRLTAVLHRLSEYGVLLNDQKCVYNVECLEILGHQLSVQGIRPTESRVAAIRTFREPQNVSELRSFLGLVCYVGKFVPHLATKTDPLRQLLRSGVQFNWTNKERAAFQEIKDAMCQIHHLGFFNPKEHTKLITDASATGLGAVLLQDSSAGNCRIIAYASKALTTLEKKYFQTEREALSLVWGVEKFKLYLQGVKFTLVTDCKALKFLFGPRSRPCPRIERWVLRLQAYTYDIEHIQGCANIADSLSRLSESSPEPFDESMEGYIHSIVELAVPTAVTIDEVRKQSQKDDTIQKVQESLQTGSLEDMPKEFKPFSNELYSVDGLLLRGNRLIMPSILQNQVLELAHESHPGIAAMKRRLRQKVWWPGLDKQAESWVKGCKQCILVSNLGPPEPLKRTRMPERPWTDIAVDFMGPLPSGHSLFVLVDYFSRFTEAIVMRQTTAKRTVEALHETFCRFGFPETIKSDNGPQFISEDIKRYCKEYGIVLLKTTPYWPQANGEVERANKTILKHLQISQESDSPDWIWDLRSFLLMYNSTPHSTTGVAPSSLMFGRILRDKLPDFNGTSVRTDVEEIRDKDWERKLKGAEYSDSRRLAKPSQLRVGDTVVAKRLQKANKLCGTFGSEEYEIVELNGADATLRSRESDRVMHRNVAHLKPLPCSTAAENFLEDSSSHHNEDDQQVSGHIQEPYQERRKVQTEESNKREPSVRAHRRPAYLDEYHINKVDDFNV